MDLPLDETVLAAAIALVDESYGTDAATRRRARRRQQRAERDGLRAQVRELQRSLAVAHASRYGDGSDLAKLWAEIAHSQSEQRSRSVAENAQLKDVVRMHLSVADRVMRLLQAQAIPLESPRILRRQERLESMIVADSLRRRLEEFVDATDAPTATPALGSLYQDVSTRWKDHLQIDFRKAWQYPFKLSLVADELWRMLQHQAFGAETSAREDEVLSQYVYELTKPFGRMATSGVTMLRRNCTEDGSVIISLAAMSSATAESRGSMPNLMSGFEMLETWRIRLSRVETPLRKPVVYLDSLNRVEIKPMVGSSEFVSRARRVESFIRRMTQEDADVNRQKIENRLMDLTLSQRT